MKRLGGLWEAITAWDNLVLAYHKARRGKRNRPAVAWFACHLEPELLDLQRELRTGGYAPGAYRQFTIYDRKPRVISAAPFRDRVVHHAVMNLVEPALDRRFIDDTYACRKGKGVHQAVARYQAYAQRYAYVLKLDIQRYFPSIDHALLLEMLNRRLKDRPLLQLLERLITASPETVTAPVYFPGDDLFTPLLRRQGIPIGNLTSQFFANLYLDDFDHWLKELRRAPAYMRYVDDLVLLDDCKQRLWDQCAAIEETLATLRLRLHGEHRRHIQRSHDWVDVLGYQVRPDRRRLRSENGYRFRRRLRRLLALHRHGRIDDLALNASIQSWLGHARHADTEGLRRQLFADVQWRRAQA